MLFLSLLKPLYFKSETYVFVNQIATHKGSAYLILLNSYMTNTEYEYKCILIVEIKVTYINIEVTY